MWAQDAVAPVPPNSICTVGYIIEVRALKGLLLLLSCSLCSLKAQKAFAKETACLMRQHMLNTLL
jgi:hypothetical protein